MEAGELTEVQERIWVAERLAPDRPGCGVSWAVRLRGRLDLPALRSALQGVVRGHEVLGAAFPTGRDGRPVRVPAAEPAFDLAVRHLGGAGEAAIAAAVRQEALAPFDVARGPLVRARLLEAGADDHVLVLVAHGLVCDRRSLAILAGEVSARYRALVAAGDGKARVAYWRARLDPPSAPLDLPADRPRPPVRSFAGAVAGPPPVPGLADRLRALGRPHGASLRVTLLAGFQAFLHRCTGQEDVRVGVVHPVRERAVGPFEDLLVVRADCSGDPPFRELLGRVAEAALGAEAHALPLAALVRALGPRRDAARPPLVQVVLDLDEGPGAAPDLPGLSAEPLDDVDTGVSWYDLRLIARERGGGLSLRAEHRADLFEPSTVARLLERLVLLLEAAVGRPDSRLSELPLLGDDERRRILGEWNATDRERPAAAIPDRFEAQAARTPDAVAVGLGGRRLTYRQLDRRANALAARLAERGVGRETLVGVAAARTPEAIVAILAVLKAGGAYVPLDPSHPEERLRFLLQDTAVALVLAEAGAEERLRAAGAACLHLRPEPEADRDEANDRPPPRATGPFDLAYVLHTSGSTGRPKGVQIEHGAVVNHVDSVAELFGLGPGDRMLQFATLTFDVSVFEVFGALLTGARLCLASQETLLSPPDLTAMLREERVTMADLPPALLALLPEDALPDLRLLFVGLEPYPGDLVNRWARGGRRFVNGYGPTEATVAVTTMECVPPMDQSPPIGGPMANHRTYVLDRNGRLAPPGIPGELHIGGVGLARGYLRRPDQTAGRFVPDAFSGRPGARLYRTGDLVRQRPDGVLEFLGRIDQQVKLRGYRVELGEIESALEAHPGVVQAAVSLAGDEAGGPRLVAYVVPRPGERPPGAAELRELAGRRLPAFMVPAAFVTLERLPLTSSGKVDRSALPAPGAAGDEPVAPPATPTERAVAAIFAGLLGRETVGAHDDFFALGGTSLDAARLLDRVRERLGVALPLTAVLQAPGVAALSELIDAAGAPADASRLLGEVGHLPDRELDVLLRAALDEQ